MTAERKKAADRFWRIYFWITIIMWVIIIEGVITGKKLWPETCTTYFKSIATGLYITATIGLFGYTYQKNIFNAFFWKIFFCVLLCWEFYAFAFLSPPPPDNSTSGCLTGLIVFFPLYLALFLYAFKYKR